MKSLKSVNPISHTMLNNIQNSIIDLIGNQWKTGGDVNDPTSRPMNTTDPRNPSDALSKFRSRLMVTVHAGMHPWSTLTRIFVMQMMMKQVIKPQFDSFGGSKLLVWLLWNLTSKSSGTSRDFLPPSFSFDNFPVFCELSSSSSRRSDTLLETDKKLLWRFELCSFVVIADTDFMCVGFLSCGCSSLLDFVAFFFLRVLLEKVTGLSAGSNSLLGSFTCKKSAESSLFLTLTFGSEGISCSLSSLEISSKLSLLKSTLFAMLIFIKFQL